MNTSTALLFILFCFHNINAEQRILVGPIIGKVTNTTSIVLVEFEFPGPVTMTIESEDTSQKYSRTLIVSPSSPIVFSFSNLTPDTRYFVSTSFTDTKASFKSLKGELEPEKPFNIVFVACDDIRYASQMAMENNLWSDMAERARRGEIDYVFHIGDQVYLDSDEWHGKDDSAHAKALKQFPDFLNHTEEVREIIREEYRKTFNFPPLAYLLANVPNIMILDDHEVHNELSRFAAFTTSGTWAHFWSSQARHVYYEYQRQLREEIDFSNFEGIKKEFFSEELNNVGFFFLDYRGSRVWHPNDFNSTHNYLDQPQSDFFNQMFALNSLEGFSRVDAAFLISTVPLFMLSHKVTKLLARSVCEDYDELWTFNHLAELEALLDTLRRWKEYYNKEVVLIGGDQHFGFHSDIYYKDEPLFKQFTTSGINKEQFGPAMERVVEVVMSMMHSLNSDYCLSHHLWTTEYNYGIVQVVKEANQIGVKSFLVTSDGETVTEQQAIGSSEYRDRNITCECNFTHAEELINNL